jgi:arylsulfatase A
VPLRNPYFSPHQRFQGTDPSDPAEYAQYSGTDYSIDLMADEALAFVRANAERPFFLYFAFTIPHVALQVPESTLAEYAGAFPETPYLGDRSYLPHRTPRAAYAAMITHMDHQIARLLTLLDSLDLTDGTLVMFSSDNGPTYVSGVDTDFFRSTGGLRGLKGSVYDGGIRVPFIARWPGQIPAGATTDHVSAFWDVLPTIADLLHVAAPPDLDGASFLQALRGEATSDVPRPLYWEYHGLWKGAQAVRLGRWKGVRLAAHERPDGPIEVYDLDTDPFETTDVAAAHPDVVARLEAAMASRTPSVILRWNFPPLPER